MISTGELLGYWLMLIIFQLLIWAVFDALIFVKDQETLSQYVIKKNKKDKWFKRSIWLSLLCSCAILIWLIFHWELI